ncbi:hypothetical protein BGX28_002392 [Mortierella sp. GBA30]|nr:hypothetical protein BGX28_002392 [Mortierella sp. GBA30]
MISNITLTQQFRVQYLSGRKKSFNIPTITDSGRIFIRWQDITVIVSDAQYVQYNDTLVPFMKDANHNERSTSLAKTFYLALVEAGGIQELNIKLDWDASMDNLKYFARAMINSNIVSLSIDGSQFTAGQAHTGTSDTARFDPIAELMFDDQLQSIVLKNFNANFFENVSPSVFTSQQPSNLQMLSIGSGLVCATPDVLDSLLKSCTSLKELELTSLSLNSFNEFRDISGRVPATLRTLKFSSPLCLITVECRNNCRTVRMRVRYTKTNEALLFFAAYSVIMLNVIWLKGKNKDSDWMQEYCNPQPLGYTTSGHSLIPTSAKLAMGAGQSVQLLLP